MNKNAKKGGGQQQPRYRQQQEFKWWPENLKAGRRVDVVNQLRIDGKQQYFHQQAKSKTARQGKLTAQQRTSALTDYFKQA